MLIKIRAWRGYGVAPRNGGGGPDRPTEYNLDVSCTPANKDLAPLRIEVSSDRDMGEIHNHVNGMVRDFVHHHTQLSPRYAVEACAPAADEMPAPRFGLGRS